MAGVAHGAVGRVLRGHYLGPAPAETLALNQTQDAYHRLHGGAMVRIEAS